MFVYMALSSILCDSLVHAVQGHYICVFTQTHTLETLQLHSNINQYHLFPVERRTLGVLPVSLPLYVLLQVNR